MTTFDSIVEDLPVALRSPFKRKKKPAKLSGWDLRLGFTRFISKRRKALTARLDEIINKRRLWLTPKPQRYGADMASDVLSKSAGSPHMAAARKQAKADRPEAMTGIALTKFKTMAVKRNYYTPGQGRGAGDELLVKHTTDDGRLDVRIGGERTKESRKGVAPRGDE